MTRPLGYIPSFARRDSNEDIIVAALEIAGYVVMRHSRAGEPDLTVIGRGNIWLMEVKAAKGKMRENQVKFRARVRSQGQEVWTVRSAEEALKVVRGCAR